MTMLLFVKESMIGIWAPIKQEVCNLKRLSIRGIGKSLKQNNQFILLCLPGVVLTFIFNYVPMYGVLMSFSDYSIRKGLFGSEFVGLKWFEQFFSSVYFGRIFSNTIILSVLNILIAFPIPIIFALMLNEINFRPFKKIVQTVSYMPHFISTVIVVALMMTMMSPNTGVVNQLLMKFGLDKGINFFFEPSWFRPLFIGSDIWQNFGWNSILYLAALSSVDQQLYEAAKIDGAGKWRQLFSITIPSISPVIITMLILSFGSMMNVGYEKVILMYTPATYQTADIISTYTYRTGICDMNLGYGAAVGLFNSVVNVILIVIFNKICQKVSSISLW